MALAALAALILAAPANAKPSTDWRLGFDSEIDFNANIFAAFNTSPYFIFVQVYEQLLNSTIETAEPDLEHSLATGYEVSDDGKVYTFHLRPGLKWADGEPLTAEDAAWSWENVANSSVNSGYVASFEKAEALDDVTVRLTFSEPDARVPQAFVPAANLRPYSSGTCRCEKRFEVAADSAQRPWPNGTGPRDSP